MWYRFVLAVKVFCGLYGVTRWKDGVFEVKDPKEGSSWGCYDKNFFLRKVDKEL